MANPEINLQRHLNRRLAVLHRHEGQRVSGDAAKDGNLEKVRQIYPEIIVDQLSQIARKTYETTIHGADIWSCEQNRRRTSRVINTWVRKKKITRERADNFLDQCDLGYAGETRIEVVTSGARADEKVALNQEDSHKWLKHALLAGRKHNLWEGTIERVSKTLNGSPIFWPAMILVDKGVIYFRQNDLSRAIECFRHARIKTRNVLKDSTSSKEEKLAAASDGGVACIRLAQLLEKIPKASPELIFKFYRQGRNLVHWSGRQSENFERSRVIELWYTQYCLKERHFDQLPSIVRNWLWLLRNHQDTRTMFKNYGIQFLHKIKERFSLHQYFEAAGHD